jgi:dipeptidyl aminopeptidase/acylaminoacyl peptidase
MNGFLGDIAEGERRLIEYQSLDGETMKGLLLLPPGNQLGPRSPLVVWVYAGFRIRDQHVNPGPLTHVNSAHWLNLQLLAARGYAVLLPSMPLSSDPKDNGYQGNDPYLELTKGVLPAVDKVIALGIADPKRVAVMGHSYGGYSTYGLVTLTNRFQVAIALAPGSADLVSEYGSFQAQERYGPYPHENIGLQWWAEAGQGGLGNPPWKDWTSYWRNSPLFYVERVKTPLLIVQGDMDGASMQQGEEFFSALYRQGKRARFVRYWGEGHSLQSPANIRDFWAQVYAWLDEHLDITRDANGRLMFEGDRVKSRQSSPPLMSTDSARVPVAQKPQ